MPRDCTSRQTSRPLLRRVGARTVVREGKDTVRRLLGFATAVVPEVAGPVVVREDCGCGAVLPRVLCGQVAGAPGTDNDARRLRSFRARLLDGPRARPGARSVWA